MIPGESRRSILRKMTLGTLVSGPHQLAGQITRTAGQSAHPVHRPDSIDSSLASPRKTTTGPTHALSLTALAAAVQHERTRSNSGEAPCVPKITRFSGFLTDEKRERHSVWHCRPNSSRNRTGLLGRCSAQCLSSNRGISRRAWMYHRSASGTGPLDHSAGSRFRNAV